MRVLLDTNILIHREAARVIDADIGILFGWLDRLRSEKCIHPISVAEIHRHKDPKVVATFDIKLQSYVQLKTEAPETPEVLKIRQGDKGENDRNDTSILKEVFARRVDCLITEDRRIHDKAKLLGIADRVFTIDDFLEKVTAENPQLSNYSVLAVKKEYFGNLNLEDPFFNEFKRDYKEFSTWFNAKADSEAYICKSEKEELLAFLYIKQEDHREPYGDITPVFSPKRRLKIGTFKVSMNGFKLGERFLKIVFDNAIQQNVDEIYVTMFVKDTDQERLKALLLDWGFREHGTKVTPSGKELVLVRDMTPRADPLRPMLTFPYVARSQRKFIVPIYPAYHTELFPDSILRTESPANFLENRPNRNAIRKVYISRSHRKDMKAGDIVVFYRTASGGSAYHTSVATTIGLVDSVITPVASFEEFLRLCRKRSVFSDAELKKHWDYYPNLKPFVVNFLYVHSLPKRPNLAALIESGVIREAPRGFEEISDEAFGRLLDISNANKRLIVD